VRPQAINMPVGPTGWLEMVPKPSTETSRAMGAANVNVESLLALQSAELANSDGNSDG
jgi:hypothetical protein